MGDGVYYRGRWFPEDCRECVAEARRLALSGALASKALDREGVAARHDLPMMLSLQEYAEWMGIAYNTAWRLASRGEVPAVRAGRHWRVIVPDWPCRDCEAAGHGE